MEQEICIEPENTTEQEICVEPEPVQAGGSGAVNSVNGYTGDVVLKASDLENDRDYQTGEEVEATANQKVNAAAEELTEDLVDEARLRGEADQSLDGRIDALNATVAGKANTEDLAKVATSGSYADLTDKPTIPGEYTLPPATNSTLGGIKVGDGLSVEEDGTLSANGGGGLPEIKDGAQLHLLDYGVYLVKGVTSAYWGTVATTLYPGVVEVFRAGRTNGQYTKIVRISGYNTGDWYEIGRYGRTGENGSFTYNLKTFNPIVGIVNNLTSDSQEDALAAGQGRVLNGKIGGDLSGLDTTDKASLIAAINELAARVAALEDGGR